MMNKIVKILTSNRLRYLVEFRFAATTEDILEAEKSILSKFRRTPLIKKSKLLDKNYLLIEIE